VELKGSNDQHIGTPRETSHQETALTSQIPVSCNRDCGGACPLLATVSDGRLVSITDNPAFSPYMTGCLRGYQMPRVVYAPDRLRKPLLRTGPKGSGEFREAEWAEALDLVAGRLREIRDRYGATSVLHAGASGSVRGALHNTFRLAARFLAFYGGATWLHSNYSRGALDFVVPYLFGDAPSGIDPGTLQFSKLIILWGANVADNRLGGETYAYVKEAKRRGVEVIVVDPRRSATVEQLGTRWIAVRPGTDSALMLALLYVILVEGLVRRDFLARYTVGFEPLERYVLGGDGEVPKTPAWAEDICGVPAATIAGFARGYARASPAALFPGYSIQRTLGGEDAVRLGVALQAATANIGIPGGSSGAFGWGGLPEFRTGALPVPTRAGQPSVPVYRWPDAVIEGRAGGYPSDIRAIYNVGGDFVVQGADVHKNLRAFAKVEFSVCHDLFLTPTARACDVVLPATTFLERNDIVFSDYNYAFFSNRAVSPQGEARNDYDIFCDLADRLGFLAEFSEGKDEEAWLRSFVAGSELPDFDEFRRTGIYKSQDQLRVGLSDFVGDPQKHPLPTPSGRIEIASERYAADTGFSPWPKPTWLQPSANYPLRLITPKSRFRVHSQHANIAWFSDHEPQALWIHPADADPRGISHGDLVLVSSPQGRVRITARVTEHIMPGVVCLLEGVWPVFDSAGTEIAGSPNVLTSTEPTLPSEASRTHSVLVQVAAIRAGSA
jgi:anaerobic dimethyl sulfoxide reductase subunit A